MNVSKATTKAKRHNTHQCHLEKMTYNDVLDMTLKYFSQFRQTYTADFSDEYDNEYFDAMGHVFDEYILEHDINNMPEIRKTVYMDFQDLLILSSKEKRAMCNCKFFSGEV